MKNKFYKIAHWWTIPKVGIFLLLLSIVVTGFGYLNQHMGMSSGYLVNNFVKDFYANSATELLSLAITLLVIEYLTGKAAIEQEKRTLISQMGSPNNVFAIEAIRLLRARNWLFDGSLHGADLNRANLEGANLNDADLRGANLYGANLSAASIQFCDLSGGYLPYADFSNATLQGVEFENANLRNAKFMNAEMITNVDFSNADMRHVNFKGAWIFSNDWGWLNKEPLSAGKFLWGAILPNGKKNMGQYELDGDIEEAKKINIDTSDPIQMKKYYRDGIGYTLVIDLPPGEKPHDNWVKKRIREM